MGYQLVQTFYWSGLAFWVGAVMFMGIAMPVIVRTVREHGPILPSVLSVNLEGHHGELLAGAIVGHLQARVHSVGLSCAAVVGLAMIAHPFLVSLEYGGLGALLVRVGLFVGAVGIGLYDWRILWPKLWEQRQRYLDHADEPEIANDARNRFDRIHRLSVNLLFGQLLLLVGLVLFSGGIRQAPLL